MGRLIDEYRETARPDALGRAGAELTDALGQSGVDATVDAFPLEFPRHLGQPEPPDREVALAQLVLLGVLSDNPAVAPFGELVDLRPLSRRAASAAQVRAALEATLDERPAFPDDARSLIELLREPARAAPELTGRAAALHPDRPGASDSVRSWRTCFDRLLIALDVLAEEQPRGRAGLAQRPS